MTRKWEQAILMEANQTINSFARRPFCISYKGIYLRKQQLILAIHTPPLLLKSLNRSVPDSVQGLRTLARYWTIKSGRSGVALRC